MVAAERDFYIAILIVVFFFFLLMGMFFYFLYRKQKKLALLQQAKTTDALIKAEQERNQMAIELHNDIVPYLAGVKLRLSLIEGADKIIKSECIPAVEKCIHSIRVISKRMVPMSIFDVGYIKAIEHYVQETGIAKIIQIEIAEKENVELDQHKQVLVYRLLQEVILNTLKHSKGKKLIIEVLKDQNDLLIRTADDGTGFFLDEQSIKMGTGIRSMQEIMETLGGEMHKLDQGFKGTRYNFRIPCRHEEHPTH
jgi:signal transduction histidine kinase